MYESYYGLKKNPFSIVPDPQYLYLGTSHREALSQLLYGIKEKKGFIVLTGEVGTGKTILLHYLLDKINTDGQTKAVFLFNPKLSVDDFIHYILRDLGVDAENTTKGKALYLLSQTLRAILQKGGQFVLFVDEAQSLGQELLEEIRLLSNLETTEARMIQIVLVGQPELDEFLKEPRFRQIKQRINLRYHLRPLSYKETEEYIEKRLKITGAKNPLFTKRAIKEIYDYSGGVPRLINILCDNSLLNAFAADQMVVDTECVEEAAKDLQISMPYFRNIGRFLSSMVFKLKGLFLRIR